MGTTWTTHSVGTVEAEGAPSTAFDTTTQSEVTGQEAVDVPAGSYSDALRVEMTGDASATSWLVKDVGPVMVVSGTTSTVLTEYTP